MPTRLKPFLLLVLITLSQTVLAYTKLLAHAKLLPGYYIDNKGDSVLCQIEFGDWNRTPQTIEVEVNNEKKTLGVNDIKGFGVTGYGDYKTAEVSYHTNPISGSELPENYSDSTTTSKVFLKTLVKGPYSLYELQVSERAKDRQYYFLQKNDGPITELIYRVAIQYQELKEDKQYVNTMAGLFLEEQILDEYRHKVYNASYNSDLVSLVKILDEKRTGIKASKVSSVEWQVALFAGGVVNFFPSNIIGVSNLNDGKLNSSTSLSGGVNLLYVIPRNFNAFKLGLSIGYEHYTTTGFGSDSTVDKADLNNWRTTTYSNNLSLTNTLIMTSIYGTYTINPLSKAKFYLKAGISLSFSKRDVYVVNSYKKTDVGFNSGTSFNNVSSGTEKPVLLSGILPNPILGAGVELNRHKLEFSYYVHWDTSGDNSIFRVGMAAVYYYFTILK